MSEAATAAAPATTLPAATPAVGTTDLLGTQLSPEAARELIAARIDDKEFYKLLQAKDPAATRQWSDLHKAGYPAPQVVASVEDVNSQAAARNAEMWNAHIADLKTRFPLTPEQEAEIRSGVVDERARRWAVEQKDLMVRDKGFYRKLMDGDREANKQWGLITSMLSLRPVKPQ